MKYPIVCGNNEDDRSVNSLERIDCKTVVMDQYGVIVTEKYNEQRIYCTCTKHQEG